MLIEDFNKENIMIDEIIYECQRLKCMESLNSFMLGKTYHFTPNKTQSSHGVYKNKTQMKSKTLPHVLFKESDKIIKHKSAPHISRSITVSYGHSTGDNGECVVFLPNTASVMVLGHYEEQLKNKNKQLLRRLTQHLNNKTSMDAFEVGECVSKVDLYSTASVTSPYRNFSESFSKVVESYPNEHKVISTYYFKPLKEWMDDYFQQCPNGSIELFENHNVCSVSCKEIPYICLKDTDLSIDELRDKFKKRMNGYA